MIFKKALINFAMIQTAIFATSVSVGVQIPASNSILAAVIFTWMVAFLITLLPSILVSTLFAFLSK